MNIVYVHPHPDHPYGSERAMCREAAGVKAAAHRVLLLHGMETEAKCGDGFDGQMGVPELFDKSWRAGRLCGTTVNAVQNFLRREKIDIVHVHGPPRMRILREWAMRFPTVVTIHTPFCPTGARYLYGIRKACERCVGFACFSAGYLHDKCGRLANGVPITIPQFAKAYMQHLEYAAALSRCARIVVPSQYLRSRLIADGLNGSRIRVVWPTIPRTSPGAIANGSDGDAAVLYVGRLVEFKGPDHLLRASSMISIPHSIWIAGDGPLRLSLARMADSLGISRRVVFFGDLAASELSALRAKASVAVVPSLVPETFGMVGPEAMAEALPVVAYDVGAVRDWMEDGITGQIVPCGDVQLLAKAISDLLGNRPFASSLGAVGHKRAQIWSEDSHTAAIMEVYDSVYADYREQGKNQI